MYTTPPTATLNCKHNTAGLIFIAIGSIFILVGCTKLYDSLGLNPEQTAAQVAEDQEAIQKIIGQTRITTTEIITTALAGVGAILSGLLAKWLGTERKITTALITGIEAADPGAVKEEVQKKAIAAGVEPQLHAKVVALT